MSAPASALPKLSRALPDRLQGHLHTARQLAEQDAERPVAVRPTGLPPVDRLLSGGLHHGRLVEIVGRRSCGRFSIALAALAATTARGEVAALVDLSDALDPQNATAAGVDLDRLLWVRPPHMKPALIATEAILGAGFPLVILDLGLPPVPGGRGAETFWLRLSRAADLQGSTLLVSAPYRVSGTAAAAVLAAADCRPGWSGRGASPRLLHGVRGRLRLEKLRGHALGTDEDLDLTAPESLAPFAPARPPREDHSAGRTRSDRASEHPSPARRSWAHAG